MKASQFIKVLADVMSKHGDVRVTVPGFEAFVEDYHSTLETVEAGDSVVVVYTMSRTRRSAHRVDLSQVFMRTQPDLRDPIMTPSGTILDPRHVTT